MPTDEPITSPAEVQDGPDYQPGEDRPVSPNGPMIIAAIKAFKQESEDARRDRDQRNKENREAFHCKQDWSTKQPGQSCEFIPKTPQAVERLAAFIKRGLVSFGDWFQVEPPRNLTIPQVLTPEQIRALMLHHLGPSSENDTQHPDFSTTLEDGVKVGLLGARMVFKVHGCFEPYRRLSVERGVQMIETEMGPVPQETVNLAMTEERRWKLLIDLVKPEDHYPDPTGRGLYEIHTTEKDLHEVLEAATGEYPLYDPQAVEELRQTYTDPERERTDREWTNQNESPSPTFRKKVQIDEFWGTLLDDEGRVVHRNVVAAIANEKFLIRPPEPNPFWHQQSPFVVVPLVRVPFSVFHKAIFDNAIDLNIALNEMFNLILDGGMAAVWGIKQLRADMLEDESQVSEYVPQGTTLKVKMELPANAKVLETVSSGEVPQDALATYGLLDRLFQDASLVNEISLGQLPQGDTTATEVMEASRKSEVAFESMIVDLENIGIQPILRKAWLTMLQNADNWDTDDVEALIGTASAQRLAALSPAERYVMLAKGATFKVKGLSAIVARARDFQKYMAIMQAVTANPMLGQAFFQRFSSEKALDQLLRLLNINPENLELTEDEKAFQQQRLKQLAMFTQLTRGSGANRGQGGGAGMAAQDVGDVSLPAEINQEQNPLTGLA